MTVAQHAAGFRSDHPPTPLLAQLSDGLRALGLDLSLAQRDNLLAYVRLIDKWNRTYNLTAIREPERMISLHLLDSLAVLPHIPYGAAMADVGSGAGLPGIPIAIARPDVRVTLIDTVAKKATFMQHAIGDLKLSNAMALHTRVEELKLDPPCNVVISRAFAELKDFAESSSHLLANEGRMLAMKGVMPHDEIARLPARFQVTETLPLRVPGVDAARHLVIFSPASHS